MLNDDVMLGVIVSFSLTSGRMRYAPTHVRLLSWPNTINHYTCSVEILAMLACVLVPFPPTSGRMRYAPTLVRLLSWLNTIHIYTRLFMIVAEYGSYLPLFDELLYII